MAIRTGTRFLSITSFLLLVSCFSSRCLDFLLFFFYLLFFPVILISLSTTTKNRRAGRRLQMAPSLPQHRMRSYLLTFLLSSIHYSIIDGSQASGSLFPLPIGARSQCAAIRLFFTYDRPRPLKWRNLFVRPPLPLRTVRSPHSKSRSPSMRARDLTG